MRISLRTVSKHWWKFLGFLIVMGLFALSGLLLCGVGIFVTLPVSAAALMYAYEDIFNPPGPAVALAATSKAPGAESGAQPDVAAPPLRPGA